MWNESVAHTPLSALREVPDQPLRQGDPQTALLTELPPLQLVNLRLDASDASAMVALQQRLGASLPTEPNTVAMGDGIFALWLGPDEWLLRAEVDHATRLLPAVEAALADHHFAATDQGQGHCALRLQGPEARDVLNVGCPLDLHPRVFGAGRCARSHFYQAGILLRVLDSQGADWELIVRRSFADYVARMLLDTLSG